MKRILGLDLGTTSIGWALVNEAENEGEESSIVKLGVRVNPLSTDEQRNFDQGKSITTNADRTLKRSMRRNLQRFKLRRELLKVCLQDAGLITDTTLLAECGKGSTYELYALRAKAAHECVSLEELARVLFAINKKRGYKSSRKAKSSDEGELIDGMGVAKELYNRHLTPGEFVLELLQRGVKRVPDFYRSDLQNEFDRVWSFQQIYHSDLMTPALKSALFEKNDKQTWMVCRDVWHLEGLKRELKGAALQLENYAWRAAALREPLDLERLIVVLQQINGQMSRSSGYLGAIGDRSKRLFFNKQTVGEYCYASLLANRHQSLKNKVFYRQDYLDEFEKIWETQAAFHRELTPELKGYVRDVVIFYQRPLKSQKGQIALCEFENEVRSFTIDGKDTEKLCGLRVCPKSSPLFQEFKIWQNLNNVEIRDLENLTHRALTLTEKELLSEELNFCESMKGSDALKLLGVSPRTYALNFEQLQGNRTQNRLYKAYNAILQESGHEGLDSKRMNGAAMKQQVKAVFESLGIESGLLDFDASLPGHAFDQQASYRLWHLLYSYQDDDSKTGDETLIRSLKKQFGFDEVYGRLLAPVVFESDYGSLSAKALRNILPFMKQGEEYSAACELAGYRHSKRSLTKAELDAKVYRERLEVLPKNSLRNPVVEKILNQMVHVVNGVTEVYGRPDEVRIEMARELKKSAKERAELTRIINEGNQRHERYVKELKEQFHLTCVSRNDLVRYKLYLELKSNGYKTLYSNTYIPIDKLFSKEFDIEHIIPKAKLFDDSFANKTLEIGEVNRLKGKQTAYDFVGHQYGVAELAAYELRVQKFAKDNNAKGKGKKLLMKESEIPSGFIDRDLRDSQYIAKKAHEMLEEMVMFVVSTTGSITDRLREDWQLVNVMQELNWNKYSALGMTEEFQDRDGRTIRRITDWSKRNDHRHHAMDALTIAFTKRQYVQYLNNLNARVDKGKDDRIDLSTLDLDAAKPQQRSSVVRAIEQRELYQDANHKLRFKPPMPLDVFRREAKRHLEQVLVSIKAKNKVCTRNVNVTKCKDGVHRTGQLTPRGQLHNETVYGCKQQYVTKEERVGGNFDATTIARVADARYRMALMQRLSEQGGDAKRAFTGKNSLAKNPLYVDAAHSLAVPERVKTVTLEPIYTIRKAVDPLLNVDKVIDVRVKRLLEERLQAFGGDAKKAFVNLEEQPIWLNREKGIAVKHVTISGVANAIPLHDKHDVLGQPILTASGARQPADYVNTGNNHHVAIYRDAAGKLQERVVSFLAATERVTQELPVVDRQYRADEGWQFLFTMKTNEYFVFPGYQKAENGENEEPVMTFDPHEVDLLDPANQALISPHLFRVQKLSSGDYLFTHHLETQAISVDIMRNYSQLVGVTYYRLRTATALENIVKVRVDHLGCIVAVGEY